MGEPVRRLDEGRYKSLHTRFKPVPVAPILFTRDRPLRRSRRFRAARVAASRSGCERPSQAHFDTAWAAESRSGCERPSQPPAYPRLLVFTGHSHFGQSPPEVELYVQPRGAHNHGR